MIKQIAIFFTLIITSFYLFPFNSPFLPGMNTKMGLAAIGLVLLFIQIVNKRDMSVDKDIFNISFVAGMVSFIGYISLIYNNATDYTYATYIISMWVWLSAAYVVVSLIKYTHNFISIELVCNYLIAVCVMQCVIAVIIDLYPPMDSFVSAIVSGEGYMGVTEGRLHGIGASLDVAGTRFAAVLIIIMTIIINSYKANDRKYMGWYIAAFIIISIVGNMIARTTLLGLIIALLYLLYSTGLHKLIFSSKTKHVWKWIAYLSIVLIPLIVYLYNTVPEIQKNIRFAFEGFFSLAEKGHWETQSNNRLQGMVVFPKTFKTWIIGDGYFGNPLSSNPYYIGPSQGDFYMGTDIGYCRFIFYFGLVGLSAFILYFFKVCSICVRKFPYLKSMFFLLLITNLIIWTKVATDIFLVFAVLMIVNETKNNAQINHNILRE